MLDARGEVLSPAADAECDQLAEDAFALLGSGCTLLAGDPESPDDPTPTAPLMSPAARVEDLPWHAQ
ncbi:hypothetical protein [Deinococcus ficus]|uniref:Uncharacterized protein n=1 Tax=Deinococcus ficus TaxID=317577 RepID=A0A221T2S0_9DEIO|nr:hypothetical protein [Deinococcus ficus]ASN83194.1 hypothetical protein DFI_18515 [Deinococcus ficus]